MNSKPNERSKHSKEARYSGYAPPVTEQNAPGVDGGASAIIYAVPLEDEEDGASAAARGLHQSSVY